MIGLLGAMMTACTEQQRQTENKAQAQLPEPPKREKNHLPYHFKR